MPPKRRSKPRNPEVAALGNAIQARMDELGLNQTTLADAAKISARQIGRYVRGQHNPSVPNLKKLCKGLRITAGELMRRAGELEAEASKAAEQ
ncbi:MAG TPA: helix-turn-helix transcriptional regulator [Solirubrobacteraceae bacterium]|nr:helix-turn-helix transcriptional regulator [Solirubrobacteraceae bacterium]